MLVVYADYPQGQRGLPVLQHRNSEAGWPKALSPPDSTTWNSWGLGKYGFHKADTKHGSWIWDPSNTRCPDKEVGLSSINQQDLTISLNPYFAFNLQRWSKCCDKMLQCIIYYLLHGVFPHSQEYSTCCLKTQAGPCEWACGARWVICSYLRVLTLRQWRYLGGAEGGGGSEGRHKTKHRRKIYTLISKSPASTRLQKHQDYF